MSESKSSSLSPYVWSSALPYRVGMYWYKSNREEPKILRVFKVSGETEWSYQWGLNKKNDVDFVINTHDEAQWAGPIYEPIEPVALPDFTD